MNSHQVLLALLVTGDIAIITPAAGRGGFSPADPPWNVEHVSRLPSEIREAIVRLCGSSPQAGHYFATYSANSQLINLHFEQAYCGDKLVVCRPQGCLHQVYELHEGRWRLRRSEFRND